MSDKNSESPKIRVLIADDHELFRQGVAAILGRNADIDVVGEAENGKVAIHKYEELHPDVVLMDINMPVCDGLAATRDLKAMDANAKILILTVSDTEQTLFDAIKSGASGYVLKNASPGTVVEGVRRISQGEPVIPSNLAMQIITEFSRPSEQGMVEPLDQLTDREVEVLRQLSTGATNREIAKVLYISENTVRNHVRNILEKLHLSNRVQAAAFAVREGYVVQTKEE